MTTDSKHPGMDHIAVKEFLTIFNIPVSAIALSMGVPTNLLNNKLNPNYRNKLNEHDENGIKLYFHRLHESLGKFLKSNLSPLPVSALLGYSQEYEPKSVPVRQRAKARQPRLEQEQQRRRLQDPRWLADHPEYLKDASPDTLDRHPHLRDLIPPPPSAEDYAKTLALFRK